MSLRWGSNGNTLLSLQKYNIFPSISKYLEKYGKVTDYLSIALLEPKICGYMMQCNVQYNVHYNVVTV